MKLYQTIDGTMIGFYQERGGAVKCVTYRSIYEMRMVTEKTYENILLPGFWDERTYEIPGRWEDRAVRVPAYQEEQLVEIPGYYETRLVEYPGHYDILPHWFEEYSITRYRTVPGYWEAYERDIPPRGLYEETEPPYTWYRWIEEHVEEYEEVFPAGYKDTRVWVEGEWRRKVFWVDATWEYQMVTVPEAWGTETIWIEPVSRTRKIWVESKYVEILIEKQVMKEVYVGQEPVYSYVDETKVRLFEVVSLDVGAGLDPGYEDLITIRNMLTGEELDTTARYLGLATRIEENEFVVPM